MLLNVQGAVLALVVRQLNTDLCGPVSWIGFDWFHQGRIILKHTCRTWDIFSRFGFAASGFGWEYGFCRPPDCSSTLGGTRGFR